MNLPQPEIRIPAVQPQSSTSNNEAIVRSKIESIVYEERKLEAMGTQLQSHGSAVQALHEGLGNSGQIARHIDHCTVSYTSFQRIGR